MRRFIISKHLGVGAIYPLLGKQHVGKYSGKMADVQPVSYRARNLRQLSVGCRLGAVSCGSFNTAPKNSVAAVLRVLLLARYFLDILVLSSAAVGFGLVCHYPQRRI